MPTPSAEVANLLFQPEGGEQSSPIVFRFKRSDYPVPLTPRIEITDVIVAVHLPFKRCHTESRMGVMPAGGLRRDDYPGSAYQ